LAATAVCVAVLGPLSADALGAGWTFAPASAPPPPAGISPSKFPVALGQVGDIEFWTPNRGVLITGGSPGGSPVPAGLYAYDGVSWHELANVCGGALGRIAWAGPDDFWTISDQRPGQNVGLSHPSLTSISLCHFLNGQVVASYAQPVLQPDSYLTMDAAACRGPSDCWFGGEIASPPEHGAFHLHWDGKQVTAVYSTQDHSIDSLATVDPNTIYEGVTVQPSDDFTGEDPADPPVINSVAPAGSSTIFHPLFLSPLPDYGNDSSGHPVDPLTVGGWQLSSDFSLSGDSPPPNQVWAIASPNGNPPSSASLGSAHTLALRYGVPPNSSDGLPEWSQVVGDDNPGGDDPFNGATAVSVAAVPGQPDAWVSVTPSGGPDNSAHVDLLNADGNIDEQDVLGTPPTGSAVTTTTTDTSTESDTTTDTTITTDTTTTASSTPTAAAPRTPDPVGFRGNAGPIACPGANDCWMATSTGWLFHYTDGTAYPKDTDPSFAGIITYRPPDGGTPALPPDTPPADDSLANQTPPPPPPPTPSTPPTYKTRLALVTNVKAKLLKHNVEELTFKLTTAAKVELVAKRKKKVVAHTKLTRLGAGRRTLKLQLDPKHWPTSLAINASALDPSKLIVTTSTAPAGASPTTSVPRQSNSFST
jgi:hypothetical protein